MNDNMKNRSIYAMTTNLVQQLRKKEDLPLNPLLVNSMLSNKAVLDWKSLDYLCNPEYPIVIKK